MWSVFYRRCYIFVPFVKTLSLNQFYLFGCFFFTPLNRGSHVCVSATSPLRQQPPFWRTQCSRFGVATRAVADAILAQQRRQFLCAAESCPSGFGLGRGVLLVERRRRKKNASRRCGRRSGRALDGPPPLAVVVEGCSVKKASC